LSTEVGSIHYSLELDTKKFDRSQGHVKGRLSSMGSKFGQFGKRAGAAAAIAAGAFAVSAIKAASDLEETLNKVDVAFGDQADSVKDWAKTSIQQMGLAEQSALDAAALFGDMSTGMGLNTAEANQMSTSLTQLGADLASFKNVSFERAQTALAGVYTGETQALKGLGVVMTQANLEQFAMSQGITKSIQDMTQAEQTQLRYSYVMEKTANAHGDFARTSDGVANRTRMVSEKFKQLQAQVGKYLLPLAAALLEWAGKFIDKLGELADKWIPKIKDAFENIKSVFQGTSESSSNVVNGFVDIKNAVQDYVEYAINFLQPAMQTLRYGFGIIVEAASALWAALSQDLMPVLGQLWNSIKNLWEALNPALTIALKAVAAYVAGVMIVSWWLLINALKLVVKRFSFIVRAVSQVIQWLSNLVRWVGNAISWFWDLGHAAGRAFGAMFDAARDKIVRMIIRVKQIKDDVVGFFNNAKTWLFDAGKNLITGFVDGIKDMASSAVDAVKNVTSKVRDFFPFSPAKKGPFSGKGWTRYSGRSLIEGFTQGMDERSRLPAESIARTQQNISNVQNSTRIYGNVTLSDQNAAATLFGGMDRNQQLQDLGVASA
jgi:phage-related protein